MKNKKKNFFKKKAVAGIFGILSFAAGFIFLDSSITGGVVMNKEVSFNPLSLVSLFLLLCSAVLIVYSLKKE